MTATLEEDVMAADSPRHARGRGWRRLRTLLILGGAVLSPAFFIVMFLTVTALVRPSFGVWAWTVPVATEGSFLILYGLDVLLQWARKPMGWLRFTPYPFAAASLVLNVWAYRQDLPGLLGHGVITVAFFLPVIAGESAVRSMTVTDDEVKAAEETAQAMRHARDLAREYRGILWRWRVPSLLRMQIRGSRPPAAVADAIRESVRAGSAEAWEKAVDAWVVAGLTRREKVAAAVTVAKRQIAREAAAPAAAEGIPQVTLPAPRKPAAKAKANRASWPLAKDVDPAFLKAGVRRSAEAWEAEHNGERMPAARLSEALRVRMSRDTATGHLNEHYGISATAAKEASR